MVFSIAWALSKAAQDTKNYNWNKCVSLWLSSNNIFSVQYRMNSTPPAQYFLASVQTDEPAECDVGIDGDCVDVLMQPFRGAFINGVVPGALICLMIIIYSNRASIRENFILQKAASEPPNSSGIEEDTLNTPIILENHPPPTTLVTANV